MAKRLDDALEMTFRESWELFLSTFERNRALSLWNVFYDATYQKAQQLATNEDIGIAQKVGSALAPAGEGIDRWVREFGETSFTTHGPDSEPIEVRVPNILLICAWVDRALDKLLDLLGIGAIRDIMPDVSASVKGDMGYVPHPELIERMERIPGAEAEVRFLREPLTYGDPTGIDSSTDTSTSTEGADLRGADGVTGASAPPRADRPSPGTDIDTSTDTRIN